jgi:hypothetical protein
VIPEIDAAAIASEHRDTNEISSGVLRDRQQPFRHTNLFDLEIINVPFNAAIFLADKNRKPNAASGMNPMNRIKTGNLGFTNRMGCLRSPKGN